MSALPIYTGGLSPCCITTIRAFNGQSYEGRAIPCTVCGEPLHVRRSAWELAHPIFPATALYNARIEADHVTK